MVDRGVILRSWKERGLLLLVDGSEVADWAKKELSSNLERQSQDGESRHRLRVMLLPQSTSAVTMTRLGMGAMRMTWRKRSQGRGATREKVQGLRVKAPLTLLRSREGGLLVY